MKLKLRLLLFSTFVLLMLLASENNSFAQAQQQKAMSGQPAGELNKQPEKTHDPNGSNKLVTIEGNPHPQQNLQQKGNPSQNSNQQEKTQKQSKADEGAKPKDANIISDDKKTVQPK